MIAFHWNKHFITGIESIDKQHKHLVDIVNKLGTLVVDNKLSYEHVDLILKELVKYTVYHFNDEQKIMAENNVDKRHVTTHTMIHRTFVKEIRHLSRFINPNNENEYKQLFEYLIHWLAYHILGTDQEMARQVSMIQSGSTPEEAYEIDKTRNTNIAEPLLMSLKNLFNQVSEKNKKLIQLNKSLEKKVLDRTNELSLLNNHLQALSYTDQLTGLHNRRFAIKELSKAWTQSKISKTPLSCMMIDADNFKIVNDTYGHDAGDIVIQTIADTLKECIPQPNLLCRLGGDEFIVICPEMTAENVLKLGNSVKSCITKVEVSVGTGSWLGSVSIGLSTKDKNTLDYEGLIKVADINVYEAKRSGKNCVKN